MNLVNGKLLTTNECDGVLDDLERRILTTLERERLDPEMVIAACHRLATRFDEARYLALAPPQMPRAQMLRYITEAQGMFRADVLRTRLRLELGDNYTQCVAPLGTLLHIAAGNVDGLPAFSVVEGLLTGNINILKLPAEDGGLSVELLSDLIHAEPKLAEYIYVFDYSSRDFTHITKLLAVADAVVVWGGDEAVSALRTRVKPNIKLIEWGHKVSFGYVTPSGLTDAGLAGLAQNMAETAQVLCSAAQGLFLDTNDMDEVYNLCERFLPHLEREVAVISTIGTSAQATLELYTASLIPTPRQRAFRGCGCGIIASDNSYVESARAPYVPWIKPLPRQEILRALHPYKNHLQTVGLLCRDDERRVLAPLFFKTGVVRITAGERMSRPQPNTPHDGEYPLRRYVKFTSLD